MIKKSVKQPSEDIRKRLIGIISSLLVICMIVSISYAFFVVLPGDPYDVATNVDIPSCASVTLSNESSLSLSGDFAAPVSDKKALSSEFYAFNFKVTNACGAASSLKISIAPTLESTMPIRAIKYALVESGATLPSEGEYLLKDNNQKLLTKQIVKDVKKQTGVDVEVGYEILNSTLAAGGSKNYVLYVWVDYYEGDKTQSGQFNNTTINKTFNAYLVVSDYAQTEGGEHIAYLSDKVLDLVSDNEYTSSQDGTPYVIKHETAVGPSTATYTKVNNFGTTNVYSATSATAVSGTDASSKFTKATDGTWTNNGTVTNTYYHVVMPIAEEGYYEICYTLGIGNTNNKLQAYITDSANSTSGTNVYLGGEYNMAATANNAKSGCQYVGYLTNAKAVRVVNRAYTNIASVTFYLQKTNETQSLDAGIRYEGNDPDNYVSFNGEEWRIIGTFEGSTIGLENGKQYTKIIRNTPMYKAWDCKDKNGDGYCRDDGEYENNWTNSTLNTYLNGEYLQNLSDSNKIAQYNGNYSTWHLRGMPYYQNIISTTNDWYLAERVNGGAGYRNGVLGDADEEIQSAIAIMYPSDYGYAAYGEGCTRETTTLGSYGTIEDWDTMEVLGCAGVDWLMLENDYEWLLSPSLADSTYAFYVGGSDGGFVSHLDVDYEFVVRPVLYLESDVYITDGTGTKADPYKLDRKLNVLSDTVIAKESDNEYTSSQDGSKYMVTNPEVITPNKNNYGMLHPTSYGNVVQYYGSSEVSTSTGATTSSIYKFNLQNELELTSHLQGPYIHVVIPILENGAYQLCYKVTAQSPSESNTLSAYVTNKDGSVPGYKVWQDSLGTETSTYTCHEVGYLTTDNALKVVHFTHLASTQVALQLQRTYTTESNGEAGVRYQGKDPNNYVQFNGEEWRIIGAFEGSTIGLEPGKYYTKIIKSESIGNFQWSLQSYNNTWTVSSLHMMELSAYINSVGSDAKPLIANNATWYLGAISQSDYMVKSAADFLKAERGSVGSGYSPSTTSFNATAGLMYPSDYGYAMYAGAAKPACDTSTALYNYQLGYAGCSAYDWLAYSGGAEWTITSDSSTTTSAYYINGKASGNIGVSAIYGNTLAVRPTLYLEHDVQIVNGTGTKLDPYILQ